MGTGIVSSTGSDNVGTGCVTRAAASDNASLPVTGVSDLWKGGSVSNTAGGVSCVSTDDWGDSVTNAVTGIAYVSTDDWGCRD